MARIRYLPIYPVMALFAATPAWAQCTATNAQSLNAAINSACATITLGNNIQLMGNIAAIDGNLTVSGGGFMINGGNQFQAFQVIGGTVSINNLTVNEALAQGSSGGSGLGGGLYVASGATVTTDNVALTNNEAAGGGIGLGAVGIGGGGYGGGIYNAGTLTLTDTTLTDNTATGGAGGTGGTGSGGGIYNAGTLTLTDTTLTGNIATGGAGGAGGSGGSGYGGGIYVNQGNDASFNGTITLSGNQAVGGSGMGGTGLSSGDGVLVLNGNITLSPPSAANQTVADPIAGSGGLTKEGSGTLTLNGNNTYAGSTTVNQGTLAVGNSSALGGGILKLAAGTVLQAAANGLTLSNLIVLNGGATVDTQSNGLVLGNLISGNSGLTKVGTGTLNLIGANTYTGGTQVDQGVLIAQDNNVLGSGGVTVSPGAALYLNETSQTVGGLDLLGTIADTLGGTGAGDYGTLNAPGNVTIDGGTLAVSACQICFELVVGDLFDIMTFDTLLGDFSAFSFDGNSCTWLPSGSGGTADCSDGPDFLLSEMPGSSSDGFYQLEVTSTATVPEPGTLPLIASAIFLFFLMRRTPKA